MFEIIIANFGFWFNFLVPVVAALFLAITHKEYIWKEFGVQSLATLAYVGIIYTLLFSVTTDLLDTNYTNGKVKSSTYYEEWTERVTYTESYSCGTTKSPRTCTRTKTRYDYHGPYYEIITNLGESISIQRRDFSKTSKEFGKKKVTMHHSGQSSIGDGDKFISYPTKEIPTSVGHTYENIIAAANNNVIHTKVPKESIVQLVNKGKLIAYPSLYKGKYGETLLNRIIDTTGQLKNPRETLIQLNKLALIVGATKQANPIIYITSEDRSFKDALSQYWKMGKKNDVTLVLGVDKEGTIQWSDVICFTNNTDFNFDMQNIFTKNKININDKIVLDNMESVITKAYIRKPMEEFAYLKENITLEWYWQVIILLGNIAISILLARKFLTNRWY